MTAITRFSSIKFAMTMYVTKKTTDGHKEAAHLVSVSPNGE